MFARSTGPAHQKRNNEQRRCKNSEEDDRDNRQRRNGAADTQPLEPIGNRRKHVSKRHSGDERQERRNNHTSAQATMKMTIQKIRLRPFAIQRSPARLRTRLRLCR